MTILEIFGHLQMDTLPPDRTAEALAAWDSIAFNRWAVLVATFIALMFFKEILHVGPHIWKCATRWRWNLTIENSMQLVRARTWSAIAIAPALTLLFSRYSGIDWSCLEWAQGIPEYLLPVILVAAFIVLRHIAYMMIAGQARNSGTLRMAHNADGSYLILLAFILLPTAGALSVFNAAEEVTRLVLLIESAVIYLAFLFHKSRILGLSYSHFRIILYLCGLELLPGGILILPFVL